MSLRRKKYGGANKSDYQRQLDSHSANKPQRTTVSDAERRMEYRSMKQMKGDLLDKKFEIERFVVNSFASDRNRKSAHELKRRGWLFNILPTTVSIFMFFGKPARFKCFSLIKHLLVLFIFIFHLYPIA